MSTTNEPATRGGTGGVVGHDCTLQEPLAFPGGSENHPTIAWPAIDTCTVIGRDEPEFCCSYIPLRSGVILRWASWSGVPQRAAGGQTVLGTVSGVALGTLKPDAEGTGGRLGELIVGTGAAT